ncbi:MAG: hypothetical protein HC849_32520 [Oscillatoriales cyanobacterium RU_3_3]|nr:hypothetical protein [Oscillatoriales cyanobacterium RU_3_3]
MQATLLVREDVDLEIVREITRILFEYRRNLVAANSLGAMISQPGGSGGLALPLHEGARAYYDREKPDFWTTNSGSFGFVFVDRNAFIILAVAVTIALFTETKK